MQESTARRKAGRVPSCFPPMVMEGRYTPRFGGSVIIRPLQVHDPCRELCISRAAVEMLCTSTLRIIPMAYKPGQMPPFHDQVRGQCHDLRRTFVHAALDGRGVVVPHTLLGVAIRSCCRWPEASYACHATAQALPRAPTIRGSDDQAAL